jgi:tetratricopeptide (TPR) repeat protein
MLYDVLLHELGHLQIIDPRAKSVRRKFGMETRAEQFAIYWCKQLLAQAFPHEDPAHNAPTPEEFSDLDPELTDLRRRAGMRPGDTELHQRLGKLCAQRLDWEAALNSSPNDPFANLYVGNCYYAKRDYPQAISNFVRASEHLPDKAIAWKCLGDVYTAIEDHETALKFFQRAQSIDPKNNATARKLRGNIVAS